MFGTRLKNLRGKKGISQRELAKIIQLSPSTVAMYELSQRSPDMYTVIKLAKFFNCTTDYLLGNSNVWHHSLDNEPASAPLHHLPVVEIFAPGRPVLAEENITGYLDIPLWINADFVYKASGVGMAGAGILDGDYALCRHIETACSGQVVLALCDKSGEATESILSFYFENGSGKKTIPMLRAANPNFPDIVMDDSYKIAGVMVALLRRQAPGYNNYVYNQKDTGYGEWLEFIQKANTYRIKPQQLKIFMDLQWKIFKKFLDNA